MMNGSQVAQVGIVGGYPNGGFPSQAFYGIMGSPSGQQKAGPSSASAPSAAGFNLFGTSSTVTVVATVLILMFGGYWLWHISY